jgi:hypothetical protein
MSMLDNLSNMAKNEWLSEKLDNPPEEEQALQTTARVATAHIWPFLAASISDDDYQNRRAIKAEEVTYICGRVAPHLAITQGLVANVLAGFDADYAILHQGAILEALPALAEAAGGAGEAAGAAGEAGSGAANFGDLLSGGGGGGGGNQEEEGGEPSLLSTPKVEHLIHQAPGGGVHGPYDIEKDGDEWKVVNALGETKGTHGSKAEAREQQKALYVNIPKAREQAEEAHEGARRHVADGDPEADDALAQPTTTPIVPPLPSATPATGTGNKEAEDVEENKSVPLRQRPDKDTTSPGLLSTPKVDQELEPDIFSYYHLMGPGGYQKSAAIQPHDSEAVPFDMLSPEQRTAHIAHEHQVDPGTVKGMSLLGSSALHQVLHDEGGIDIAHYHPAPGAIALDRYGHISLGVSRLPLYGPQGGYDRSRDPQRDEGPDPFEEYWNEQESGNPEHDVGYDPDEPEYEADWDRPHQEGWPGYRGSLRVSTRWWDAEADLPPGTFAGPREIAPERRASETRDPEHWAPSVQSMTNAQLIGHISGQHLGPPRDEEAEAKQNRFFNQTPAQLARYHRRAHMRGYEDPMHDDHFHGKSGMIESDYPDRDFSASLRVAAEEKGGQTVTCPICHKQIPADELEEHMRSAHGVGKETGGPGSHGKKPPGAARAGQSKPRPSAGRQTHKPGRKPGRTPAKKEGQLVRSQERPLGARRSLAASETGYDPSEAFPGYYGAPEVPIRGRTVQVRTGQAPLTGQADVPSIGTGGMTPPKPAPQTPASDTGASGMFNPGAALDASAPGGMVGGNFAQSDAPQDIQAQLGQLPALSHKIGAKLAEMATEALLYNPGLSATAAMELALKAVRLYPKVAAGGSDYLAEPGTEGVPTEVLTDCPQCQWQAYNRQVNRCHNCGFWDTGLEPSIEIT